MHSCAVAQHLTTEPCLDDVFGGGQEGNYVLDCCTEIFRCLPQDSSESFLFNGMIVRHEMPNLYRILVMQNKLRVSYCNYSLIGKQGNPGAIGKYNAPSVRAFQSCRFQGTGTFRHSEFLRRCGNQQDSENCGNKAAADIDLAQCPLV